MAERVNVTSGHVTWSKQYTGPSAQAGSVVGFAGETVLVDDTRSDEAGREHLRAFDVNTGDQLWSAAVTSPNFTLHKSTVTTSYPDGGRIRIDRRNTRTGKLVASRTLTADESGTVFGGEDRALYLLKYAKQGFITSVAGLDAVTLRPTQVLATFDKDPGTPLTADGHTVSFLLNGHSITRVTRTDGSTKRLRLSDAPEGTARAQGITLYLSRADGTLASYNLRTGQRNWTADTETESPARPVLADGRLYSLAGDGRITCLEATTY